MKKTLLIIALVLSLVFIVKEWHVLSLGFKTNKIQPPLDMRSEISETPTNLPEDFLKIFDQEYKLLDKGCQVFVFESQDGKYVLKFLRHHRYKPYFWMNFWSFLKPVKTFKEHYAAVKKERIKNNFKSYLMSYDELKDLTEVVYVHIGYTDHINKKLVLRNRFGQKSYADLDKMHFIVQRKGTKLSSELLSSYKNKSFDRTRELIDGYLTLLQKRCLKKIRNCDSTGFLRNMALYDSKVIEIDVGGYRKFCYPDEKKGFEYEYMRFVKRFKRWSSKKMPLLVQYIDIKSKKILDESLTQFN